MLETARAWGGRITITDDVPAAARGADAIYTDVWISMGQEAERERRLEAFSRYQVNDRVMGFAKPGAVVMHCLPAHRGEEITDAVLDGPQSVVLGSVRESPCTSRRPSCSGSWERARPESSERMNG